MGKKNVEAAVNEVLSITRSHHEVIYCQLCTGPFWSTPIGDRTELIDDLTDHLLMVHADKFEQVVRES